MKRDACRLKLRESADWDALLQQESALPGPRANLELAFAAAEEGDESRFRAWASPTADEAPENTPAVFLVVCGVLGLGRLLAEGRRDLVPWLRELAGDRRWRVREAVAMALQTWGDADMEALLAVMAEWSTGTPYEQRAVVAALCEPRLLRRPDYVARVLELLDVVTASVVSRGAVKGDNRVALRKTLGYGWSVAVVALPEAGKAAFARWASHDNADIRWVVRENLSKDRLRRMDPGWVEAMRAKAPPGRG